MRAELRPRRAESRFSHVAVSRGILGGVIGGLAGTIVMDLIGIAVLLIAGGPDTISFSLIGDAAATFFSRIGIEISGGAPFGAVTGG